VSENNFKFSPAAVPQAEVVVEVKPAPVLGSDDERIATARAVGIQHDRASNADPNFGGRHHPAFFLDPKGLGSAWLARHILFMAQLIDTPASLINGKYLRDSNEFDPCTGIFESTSSPLSLFELTVVFKLRIRELGLSQVLIEEWASTIHTIADDKEFYAMGFEARMQLFKSAKA
jgi:hypothetical protein